VATNLTLNMFSAPMECSSSEFF